METHNESRTGAQARMQAILAVDRNGGLGYKGKLPWHIPEELKLFNQKTQGKIVVMGTTTAQSIPFLKNRYVICLSKHTPDMDTFTHVPMAFVHSFEHLERLCKDRNVNPSTIFIAGGAKTYQSAFALPNLVQRVHLSTLNEEYECDTFFDKKWLNDFVIVEETKYEEFTHYVMERTSYGEMQYLNLLEYILSHGHWRDTRNAKTVSSFKHDFTFDLRNGFPLLTTKKMFLRGIVEELLFFLRGDTDSTILSEKGVRIWEGNTSEEFIKNRRLPYAKGVMGPLYGRQWRFFNAPYTLDDNGRPLPPQGGVDQLANVVELIKNDPHSRRILMTSYNPSQAEEGVLFPCHSVTIQFYVDNNYLDMFCYNRSQDLPTGVPFNIASSSLLLMIVAKLTGKEPRFLYMTMGDVHIYESQCELVKEQITRIPYKFPTISIPSIENLDDIHNMKASEFKLDDYKYHPSIKYGMVA